MLGVPPVAPAAGGDEARRAPSVRPRRRRRRCTSSNAVAQRRRARGDAVEAVDAAARRGTARRRTATGRRGRGACGARDSSVPQREAQHPLDRVVAVVVDLFERLLRDRGEGRVARVPQRRVELEHVRRGDELPGDRLGEVAVRLLDDPRAAELRLVAEVGEVVLGAPGRRARVVQERAGVAEQVERDVAERDVLLELGGAGDPPAQLLRRGSARRRPARARTRRRRATRSRRTRPASSAPSASSSTVTEPWRSTRRRCRLTGASPPRTPCSTTACR